MKRTVLVIAVLFCGGLAGLGAVGAASWRALNAPLSIPEGGLMLEVAPGTPLIRIADRLAQDGVLEHPTLFALYARLKGDSTRIHAGEYRVDPGTTPVGLLEKWVTGQVYLHQFTIVEGWRFSDLLSAVRAHPAIKATDTDAESIMAVLGKPDTHPEGQFLPDTYRFAKGTEDLALLRRAHEALERELERVWRERQPTIAIDTPYEALILASIIEKETALASERRQISGVFHRRLQRGMRLQTDPTVIYGLADAFDGDLRRGDLSRDTPYNTYTRHGLPPTPIALPGAASLAAAVNPDAGDALYFVASGEPDGSHYFSDSLEQHNAAVARYLAKLRRAAER